MQSLYTRQSPDTRQSLQFLLILLFVTFLSACAVPEALPTPPAPCESGQTNTPETPCIPDDSGDPTTPGTPTNPNTPTNPGTPTDPANPGTPVSCENTTVKPRTNANLFQATTTLKSCYAPGSSNTSVMGVKLLNSSVVFAKPLFVFDIVRVNPDKSTTSVAADLLDGRPSANPNIFESDLTKEQLLAGLRASIAFKFKGSAPKGNYIMVLSLFKDADAYNAANLVGRIFYDIEIK
jgi:hypothetical protein